MLSDTPLYDQTLTAAIARDGHSPFEAAPVAKAKRKSRPRKASAKVTTTGPAKPSTPRRAKVAQP
jgi:hypothetical protein